jgi:hypothetical protein
MDLRGCEEDCREVGLNKVAQLNATARAELFAETANRLGLPESLVEKDFWVCWTLDQLFSIEEFKGRLLFKGGTSLSKVFGAIARFSEDIDLAVDYTMLGFTGASDPQLANLSRSKQNALLLKMIQECQNYIRGEFIDRLRERCRSLLGPEGPWSLSVDAQDPNVVRFQYPRAVTQHVAYIAPQVVLELGTHAEFVPRGDFTIRSFAAGEFPALFERTDVAVTNLLAKRTFWEKATILHAEFHRPAEKPMPGRYSRHYFDVAVMAGGPVKAEAFADLALLAAVVRHKRIFYPSAWAQYPLASPGTFRLLPPETRLGALREDYRDMAVMIFGDAPRFDTIIETLAKLEKELNSLRQR